MNYFECCHHCVAPKRKPGCHDTCPDYTKAKAKFEADKAKHYESANLKNYVNKSKAETVDGVAKYMKKRHKRRGAY